MAPAITLPALLDSLTNSLTSAIEATPKLAGIAGTENGVSLFDVKNELFLSYLQNLVFLILLKIRNARGGDADSSEQSNKISDDVVAKLVELRLYLEKGVRPLEERLRFQLDKIIRAVDDADRNEQMAKEAQNATSGSESGSDDDDDDDADAGGRGKDSSKARGPADANKQGPLFSNFSAPVSVGMAAAATAQDKTGVYRPPRIAPTVMPTTERRERTERRPMKSATISEYIEDELSTAPSALPSVGSNVTFGGRKVKTASEREEEQRRRDFEEENFVRLPKDNKKQRAEKSRQERRSAKMSFGGEEWRDLGEGVDRIAKLTARREGGGSSRSTKALLEKSRKRGRDTIDSNRGSGMGSDTKEIGDRFNKKLKVMEGGRRDRGKR